MKKIHFLAYLLCLSAVLNSCGLTGKDPVEKYNSFVSLSNYVTNYGDRQITNHSGQYQHLITAAQNEANIQITEGFLKKVEAVDDNSGTKEATAALGKFCINSMKTDYVKIIEFAKGKKTEETGAFAARLFTARYAEYDKLYTAFDEKISAFAKAHNIKQQIINPGASGSR